MLRKLYKWYFCDRKTGKLILGQTPNLLAILLFSCIAFRFVLNLLDLRGTIHTISTYALALFLSLWSLDELLRGDTPFRRTLGLLGVIGVISIITTQIIS